MGTEVCLEWSGGRWKTGVREGCTCIYDSAMELECPCATVVTGVVGEERSEGG